MISVLVACDATYLRELTGLMLTAARHDVETASDAESALAQVIALRPDSAALDALITGNSGAAVLRAIRRHADHAQTCVVLLTANAAVKNAAK